jgi:basic membrane lipoprotein Med (substrate-binding protein (PBP1-ABC) superfamily)
MFYISGGMGSAAILDAASRGVYAIGVDQDQSKTNFFNRPEDNYLLSSAMKNLNVAVTSALTLVKESKTSSILVLDTSLRKLPTEDFEYMYMRGN